MTHAAPPTEADPLPGDPDQFATRWPKVIGIISLIYASFGLVCSIGTGVWAGIAPTLPEMFRGGARIPLILQVTMGLQGVLGLALAIMLLVGAINLLRRRPAAVRILRRWAVLRIGLLFLGALLTVLTAPAQLQMQRSVLDFRNRMLREADRPEQVVEKTDRQLWRETLRGAAIGSAVLAIYPAFLGIYLSRRTIGAQVARWDAEPS